MIQTRRDNVRTRVSQIVELELDDIIKGSEYLFWDVLQDVVDQGPWDDIEYEIVDYRATRVILKVTGYTYPE